MAYYGPLPPIDTNFTILPVKLLHLVKKCIPDISSNYLQICVLGCREEIIFFKNFPTVSEKIMSIIKVQNTLRLVMLRLATENNDPNKKKTL